MNIEKAMSNIRQDLDDVNGIADTLYNTHFRQFFDKMRTWYGTLKSDAEGTSLGMTDAELEYALADLPLELFAVSEELSKFKLNQEVIKLRIKELDAVSKSSKIDNPEIDEDKLIQSIYASVTSRVESEISFSREFIMVMKKFWDSRRATEQINPVSEVNPDLPEYTPSGKSKRYVG